MVIVTVVARTPSGEGCLFGVIPENQLSDGDLGDGSLRSLGSAPSEQPGQLPDDTAQESLAHKFINALVRLSDEEPRTVPPVVDESMGWQSRHTAMSRLL